MKFEEYKKMLYENAEERGAEEMKGYVFCDACRYLHIKYYERHIVPFCTKPTYRMTYNGYEKQGLRDASTVNKDNDCLDFEEKEMNEWRCPICRRGGWFVRTSDTSVPLGPGHRVLVCKRCEKKEQEEIQRRQAVFYTPPGSKKDPNCAHQWVHPYHGRWYCRKCFATYNWMCGCGGSYFVCEKHYQEQIKQMGEDPAGWLAERAW